jgi:hypothetical protein
MQVEQQIPTYSISRTAERLTAAAGIGAMTIGSAYVAYLDPTASHFFPVCPLFEVTGFACPGCGLTRGFHALFHGDVSAAMHFNALIPVWVVIFGYVFLSLCLLAIRGRGLKMWPTAPSFLWSFMIVLLVFGVLRNMPIYPLSLLFP